jgi:hypothetical protein
MKLSVSGTRSIDFRVSTLPTLFGEKIVMRILDGSQAQLGIDPIHRLVVPRVFAAVLVAVLLKLCKVQTLKRLQPLPTNWRVRSLLGKRPTLVLNSKKLKMELLLA